MQEVLDTQCLTCQTYQSPNLAGGISGRRNQRQEESAAGGISGVVFSTGRIYFLTSLDRWQPLAVRVPVAERLHGRGAFFTGFYFI